MVAGSQWCPLESGQSMVRSAKVHVFLTSSYQKEEGGGLSLDSQETPSFSSQPLLPMSVCQRRAVSTTPETTTKTLKTQKLLLYSFSLLIKKATMETFHITCRLHLQM